MSGAVLSDLCPTCGADGDARCVTVSGKPARRPHALRPRVPVTAGTALEPVEVAELVPRTPAEAAGLDEARLLRDVKQIRDDALYADKPDHATALRATETLMRHLGMLERDAGPAPVKLEVTINGIDPDVFR